MLLSAALWVWLMMRAVILLGGSIGIWLALLYHLLVMGCLAGLLGIISMVFITIRALVIQVNELLSAVYVSLGLPFSY